MKLFELTEKLRSLKLEHGGNCEVDFNKIDITLPDNKHFEFTKDTEVVRTKGLREDYYAGCYFDMSDDKMYHLGKFTTLRELLDCWWNSVQIGDHVCYKNAYYEDDEYELDGLDESALDRTVRVSDYYEYDGDNYPTVWAWFVDDEQVKEVR